MRTPETFKWNVLYICNVILYKWLSSPIRTLLALRSLLSLPVVVIVLSILVIFFF